ncbi:MAG: thioredoxin domain-containing protein [Actinomycetota bacterium]|nr:thioredoxin domain-containing protein [Actinomycetota bacterium]
MMPSNRTPAPVEDAPPARELSNKERRKLSKREQAAYSLEMVEVRRKEQRARLIRRRVTRIIAIVAAVAVVGTGSGLIIWANIRAGEVGPANMLSDGILLTGSTNSTTNQATITAVTTDAIQADAKPVPTNLTTYKQTANIVLYVDYGSPATASFDKAQGTVIDNWLAGGYITLEIHPVSTSSTSANDYSKRAANAAACVAANDPNQFLAVHAALLKAASTKKETTMTTSALAALVTKAGVTDTKVTDCINGTTFGNWVTAATQRASHGGLLNANVTTLKSVPLLVVNKKAYTGKLTDSTALTTFISNTYAASASGGSTASPTPTPTPTP